MIKVLMAGGGTGGHLFPALAVAEEFMRRDERTEILFVGTGRPVEQEIFGPRNLDTRVELLAPVEDPALRGDLLDALERCFADDTSSWELGEDGGWTRRVPADPEHPRNAQRELMERHAARAAEAAQAT